MTRVGFVECLTADFERIPDRAFYEECASRHFIDLEAVDRCVARDGGENTVISYFGKVFNVLSM